MINLSEEQKKRVDNLVEAIPTSDCLLLSIGKNTKDGLDIEVVMIGNALTIFSMADHMRSNIKKDIISQLDDELNKNPPQNGTTVLGKEKIADKMYR